MLIGQRLGGRVRSQGIRNACCCRWWGRCLRARTCQPETAQVDARAGAKAQERPAREGAAPVSGKGFQYGHTSLIIFIGHFGRLSPHLSRQDRCDRRFDIYGGMQRSRVLIPAFLSKPGTCISDCATVDETNALYPEDARCCKIRLVVCFDDRIQLKREDNYRRLNARMR